MADPLMCLSFALMGMAVGCLVGLWAGIATERTRTNEVRRVFRSRLRTYRRRLEAAEAARESPGYGLEPSAFEQQGGAEPERFGVIG